MSLPHATQPRSEARAFELRELFFSTTDARGVITGGNDVFARVAGYGSVEELLGRPHSVVRHPDMPRAVFQLLWNTLGEGRAVVAYVKNLATDGRHYWVVALAVPAGDGYLSVRFKPTSPIFDVVKGLYAEMLTAEQGAPDRREGMRRSTEIMLSRLRSLGYESYEAFASVALAAELSSRRASLGAITREGANPALGNLEGAVDRIFALAESFLGLIRRLDAVATALSRLSRRVHLLSLNALIASCRLADVGRGLAVITDSLAMCSKDMTLDVSEMSHAMRAMSAALRQTSLNLAAARLQVEMALVFSAQAQMGVPDGVSARLAQDGMRTLVDSLTDSTERLIAELPENRAPVALLIRHGDRLEEAQMMLSSVHVIGRVEATAVGVEELQALFTEVLAQLQVTQVREMAAIVATLRQQLRSLESAGAEVRRALFVVQADRSRLAAAA